ncbi:Tissue alpha-L-fucosidase [Fulvia fulva]|uniref:alpha-L-fucosidase n=1 Tax=Passalora fulva TaxID=5499 RepID=A0A9Q8LIV7_PASFU|nr:Tissue alpha-L-fucosidase [Fulvia fulva]KAK4624790.1 Tissue alpha-L-fucosidase [Fulvia fulva]UJO18198.1 Tissue alpha-L-fucosidase [Fulvia fulva]
MISRIYHCTLHCRYQGNDRHALLPYFLSGRWREHVRRKTCRYKYRSLCISYATVLSGLLPLVYGRGGLVVNPKNTGAQHAASIPVDISNLTNNRAFAMRPGDADSDGVHSGYPAHYLPDPNFSYSGVDYIFPQYKESGNDNVLAQAQIINPPAGRYFSIHMLAAAETAIATGTVNVTYTDNSTDSGPVLVDPFWAWPYPYGGDIIFPYYLANSSIDCNRSMLCQTINWLDSTKQVASVQLPNVTRGAANGPGAAAQNTRLHIFAVSMVPATGTGIELEAQLARSTNLWFEGTNKTQIVEVRVNNVGSQWILANDTVKVTVSAEGLETVIPGVINRLRPGDQAIVQVGVDAAADVQPGSAAEASVQLSGAGLQTSSTFNATRGIMDYDASYDSIYAHESPPWFTNGKFGIFIHWGVYSVPGWGNVGNKEQYAEWYWWYMNQGKNRTQGHFYEYNLETYGPEHVYDDFIQNFTTDAFEPKDWVDLFADSGAQYFVQVSKHHEGYALFDIPSTVTNRTSVAQFPHKNLLQMLFDAADQYQPHLHKATYFSLPEWFHPDYKPFGFGEWPGGNATNPYTNETLPYTGYVPVDDFVSDPILPEMLILADMGTEIMWCDIGGPNLTAQFAAQYFNDAAREGKQVLINNRCGLPGDFDTPEYARYEAVQVRKWESSLGMDPFSYGYNRATPDDAYLKPIDIVRSLVDLVPKNGNFLLDVGPTANGTIIEIEQRYLRDAGKWIHEHGEAIFNTTYWFITPEEGENLRFTQNGNAFYIHSMYPPNGTLVIDSPVPYIDGDQIVGVGGNMSGTVVPSKMLSNGSLEITVDEAVVMADRYTWGFKIPYGGVDADMGSGNGTDSMSAGAGSPAQQTGAGFGKASSPAVWTVLGLGVVGVVLCWC